jgi:Uncharacterized protein conserved in bacteria (DUF2252)
MKRSAFIFLRATYVCWAKLITSTCPEPKDAPQILSVGDTHVENFGTWRDAEGRLVWGINDFDEAATMPYPLDLVRLAASVRLSPKLHVARPAADLGKNAGQELTVKLLRLMGFDLGSIHMGTPDRYKPISKDLKRRPKGWLQAAAKRAVRMVKQDYVEWAARKR